MRQLEVKERTDVMQLVTRGARIHQECPLESFLQPVGLSAKVIYTLGPRMRSQVGTVPRELHMTEASQAALLKENWLLWLFRDNYSLTKGLLALPTKQCEGPSLSTLTLSAPPQPGWVSTSPPEPTASDLT